MVELIAAVGQVGGGWVVMLGAETETVMSWGLAEAHEVEIVLIRQRQIGREGIQVESHTTLGNSMSLRQMRLWRTG